MKNIFILGVAVSLNNMAYASSNWFVKVNNNSDSDYKMERGMTQCWNFSDDAGTIPSVFAHSSETFKTYESYIFPKCSIGQHYVEWLGYLSGLGDLPAHRMYFSNVLDLKVFPYPTYEKRLYWINYSDKTNRDGQGWEAGITCDTTSKNGDLYLTVDIDKKGNAILSAENCVKFF